MGTIALRYTRPVIGTFFLESRMVVNRARPCVITVAKTRCHVVRKIAKMGLALGIVLELLSSAHTEMEIGRIKDPLVEDDNA